MRILLLTDLYAPIIGGLERHVQKLACELTHRGHAVAVATMAQSGAPPGESRDGFRVHRIRGWSSARGIAEDPERRFHPPFPDPGAVAALKRVYSLEKPDIVHAHSWILFSALVSAIRGEAALVATLHDFGGVCPKKTFLHPSEGICSGPGIVKCVRSAREQYGLLKALPLTVGLRLSERLYSHVDWFIAVSRAVAEATAPVLREKPIEVIPNFVEDGLLDEQPAIAAAARHSIVFAGPLSRAKGIHLLLEAWQLLPQPRPPLVLLGMRSADTPRSWPRGVVVRENVAHREVMAELARARIAVLPSITPDACPTVALEAMAAGAPLVATAVGGFLDIVRNGQSGLLVPPRDGSALSAAMDRLLADDALWTSIAENARVAVTRFRASEVVPCIEAAYAAALAKRKAAAVAN
jgi:glycosyltransferase involved in cell wall biosynthesis